MDCVIKNCKCAATSERVRLVPLSSAYCAFECVTCNASELVCLRDTQDLGVISNVIQQQFRYERGWSEGKFLVCFGKLSSDPMAVCDNENPEAFRFDRELPRPCDFLQCQNSECGFCIPFSDYQRYFSDCGGTPSQTCQQCPMCSTAMKQEQADAQSTCRICMQCQGAIPLSKIRQYERLREVENKSGLCAECGGEARRGRGILILGCCQCLRTIDIRHLRADSSKSVASEDPVECRFCEGCAFWQEDPYCEYEECVKCKKVWKRETRSAASSDEQQHQEDGIEVCINCKCKNMFVCQFKAHQLIMSCDGCGYQIRTIDLDDTTVDLPKDKEGVLSSKTCYFDSGEQQQHLLESPAGKRSRLASSSTTASFIDGNGGGDDRGTANVLYKLVRINSLEALKEGDHIAIVRLAGTYQHHMIVESVDAETAQVTVIEYSGGPEKAGGNNAPGRLKRLLSWRPGVIERNVYQFDLVAEVLLKCEYTTCDAPSEVLKRARARLEETKYNLATNNCEHFAVWCKTGSSSSQQVATFIKEFAANFNKYVENRSKCSDRTEKPTCSRIGLTRSQSATATFAGEEQSQSVANTLQAFVFRTYGTGYAVTQLVEWARLAIEKYQAWKRGEIGAYESIRDVLLDLVRRLLLSVARLGAVEVERWILRYLLVFLPSPVAYGTAVVAGALVYAAGTTVAKRIGSNNYQ